MVVVEENDEDARVVTPRFTLLVIAVANLLRRGLARLRVPVHLDESELLDFLRLVVLENVEVGLLQIRRRLALRVGHVRVDGNEIDARAECELSLIGRLLVRRRCLTSALLGTNGQTAGERYQEGNEKRSGTAHSIHDNPDRSRLP